jgi:hypothetical protein
MGTVVVSPECGCGSSAGEMRLSQGGEALMGLWLMGRRESALTKEEIIMTALN